MVCRSLGLPGALEASVGAEKFGQGSGAIWLDNVTCSGNEQFIQDCSHSGFGVYNSSCLQSRDAGVVCSGEFVVSRRIDLCPVVQLQYVVIGWCGGPILVFVSYQCTLCSHQYISVHISIFLYTSV